jgi:hypothetical protein
MDRFGIWEIAVYCYTPASKQTAVISKQELRMSNQANDQDDGSADSIAAVAIISVVVLTLYIWLSGMPT